MRMVVVDRGQMQKRPQLRGFFKAKEGRMEMNAERCSGERGKGNGGPLETADGGCVEFVDRDFALWN